MEALVPAVIPGPCLVEDEGNDSLVDLNQHWVFVAFGPCRGGALSPPALLGLMGISIKSVGADLCVGPWRVPRRGVSGRTHRSAPTRCGKRSGDNGNWHGKRTFPLRGGTEPAPLQKNGSKLVHGGVRLGCGFRQPNSETEFGASVMVTPPYGCVTGSAQQRADVGIGPYALRRTARRGRRATGGCGEPPRLPWPAAHSGAFVPAGARKWVGIAAEIIPKVSSNLGQSLSHGEAVTAPFTQGSLWGRGDTDCRVASLLAMTVLILCHSEEAQRADVGIRPFSDGRGFGPPYLGHGLRRPNFVPKFGASVKSSAPTDSPINHPSQPARSEASAPAWARDGRESVQRPSQKGDRRRDRPGSA